MQQMRELGAKAFKDGVQIESVWTFKIGNKTANKFPDRARAAYETGWRCAKYMNRNETKQTPTGI